MVQGVFIVKIESMALTSSSLLKIRLCDLPISLTSQPFQGLRRQLEAELTAVGLRFRPYFWISDEWFCPDGYSGIAVPFYILHPQLRKIEEDQVGRVDGESPGEILKILRHETGHAVENAFGLKRHPLRIEGFGSHKRRYPKSYKPQPYSKAFVKNLGDGYAQSHPDEDFAETFAVWLDPTSDWKHRYRNSSALKKLIVVDELMAQNARASVWRGQRGRYEDISLKTYSLAEHYRRKKVALRFRAKAQALKEYGWQCQPRSNPSVVCQFLTAHQKDLVYEVSKTLGQPQHIVQRVVIDLLRQNPTNTSATKLKIRDLQRETLDLLTVSSLIYLEKGLDRVVL
ncbi:MAG: hypothetical protein KDD22_08020 [Bdellovibrionales bacterium]|nr:hypothetical protein [Bdellovibrionales bacterium]